MAKTSKLRGGAPGPRRRPKHGGYARGDETRANIVQTAIRVFGDRGYAQASTREIATEAGVNPPALQYYFGGKEGLHRACAEFIIESALVGFTPALARAGEAIRRRGRREAADALYGLLDAITETSWRLKTESLARFMARGRTDGAGPGIEMIRERVSTPVFEAMAGLVGIVTRQSAESERTRLRALLILGQVHWIHANRDYAMRMLGWTGFDSERMAVIEELVREHTGGALGDDAPARSPKAPRRR
jgi:TetR/AcrR family transcriptional regulator, regulator of cefoperazone and chloramphenicol sensitivity